MLTFYFSTLSASVLNYLVLRGACFPRIVESSLLYKWTACSKSVKQAGLDRSEFLRSSLNCSISIPFKFLNVTYTFSVVASCIIGHENEIKKWSEVVVVGTTCKSLILMLSAILEHDNTKSRMPPSLCVTN